MTGADQLVLHDPDRGQRGDCLRACIATLFGWPTEAVPHFAAHGTDDGSPDDGIWWWALIGWLAELDPPHDVRIEDYDDGLPPAGLYLLVGGSPRGDFPHVVVAEGRDIVHDPHPSRAGVTDRRKVYVIRAAARTDQEDTP